MTLEELEIIIKAKIEEVKPQITKMLKDVKNAVNSSKGEIQSAVNATSKVMQAVKTQGFVSKIAKAVQTVKARISNLNKFTENNEIELKVNNKNASQQITQLEKEIDSLQKKISARQMKLSIINPQIDSIVANTKKDVIPQGVSKNNPAMDKVVNNSLASNKEFTSLNNQANKLYTEIEMYSKQLDTAKTKASQLKKEVGNTGTSQNKLTSFFSIFKNKLQGAVSNAGGLKRAFNQIPKITQKVTNHIKNMGTGLRGGLKNVLKYAMALFSLRGVYSILSNCASTWLSSQNSAAKQLNANIEYMKYAMGSALAPVIQYVVNLVYKLMKAIQSVVYALTGVNIFAKASAKSYNAMANSAKKAKKETQSLADIDEIHNIQENNSNADTGTTTPNMDLSQVDGQMGEFASKLYDFFKPLVESWNKYGPNLVKQIKTTASQVTGLISSVWESFEKIITNGTVYTSLELILVIIGNIAEAFSNAWNYNGNGDAIVQNLANAFNNLLTAVKNVVQSPGFQEWLKNCSDKFREISEKIAQIDWQPLMNALFKIGSTIGTMALNIISGLVDVFKFFVEHPELAGVILGIAVAIKTLSLAFSGISGLTSFIKTISEIKKVLSPIISIISKIGPALGGIISIVIGAVAAITGFVDMLKNGFSWLNEVIMVIGIALVAIGAIILGAPALVAGIIAAIVAVIATLVVLIKQHWEEIKGFFSNLWQGIKNGVTIAFTAIKNSIATIWNSIKTTIIKVTTNVKDKVVAVFDTMKNKIKSIMSGIKSTIKSIWDGIWGAIKKVINSILSGIERMANGIVRGMNRVIDVLNNLKVHIPDWVPLFGGKDIGFRINKMSQISIPKLATGTNYIPKEGLYHLHEGEAVVPKRYNPSANNNSSTSNNSVADIKITNELKIGNKTLVREIIPDLNSELRRLGYQGLYVRG